MEFNFCYPACPSVPENCNDLTSEIADTSFSFSQNPGKVFMLEMSASWWAPCYTAIPEGDAIVEYWNDDPRGDLVEIVFFLDDLGEPYSCLQWGHQGSLFIPSIIDDGFSNPVREWFPSNPSNDSQYPLTVFINHNKEIVKILNTTVSMEDANYYINSMLDEISQ